MAEIHDRKLQHIAAVIDEPQVERNLGSFDVVQLMHRGVCEQNLEEINLETVFLKRKLARPFLISSMTGGKGKDIEEINTRLALAAQECKVALALGSMRILMEDASCIKSFQLRSFAPDIPILANIGAAQLRSTHFDMSKLKTLLEMIDADALIVHFNPLQEAVQPNGDGNFKGVLTAIKSLSQLGIPILAKEVGCGFSSQDFILLYEAGVKMIDVAGRGGTSFSAVEYLRRRDLQDDLGLTFQDWGIPTPESLIMGRSCGRSIDLIASGGIRSGIDMAKALAIGAKMVGVAKPLLKPALESAEAVIHQIHRYDRELKTALFLCGHASLDSFIGNEDVWFYEGGKR